jgi:hypothetical protein
VRGRTVLVEKLGQDVHSKVFHQATHQLVPLRLETWIGGTQAGLSVNLLSPVALPPRLPGDGLTFEGEIRDPTYTRLE